MSNNLSAGELLGKIRARLNMTQQELGSLLSLDRTYINAIENGKREPSLKVYRVIQDFWKSVENPELGSRKEDKTQEDQTLYGDPLKQLKSYLEQLFFLAEKKPAVVQAWVLQQIRLHVPLGDVEKMDGKVEPLKDDLSSYKTKPIEGTGLMLSENVAYRERRPVREARPEAGSPDVDQTALGE